MVAEYACGVRPVTKVTGRAWQTSRFEQVYTKAKPGRLHIQALLYPILSRRYTAYCTLNCNVWFRVSFM